MESEKVLRVAPRIGAASSLESLRHSQQTIGDSLHRGNHGDDIGMIRSLANKACGMEHAIGTQQRTPTELKSQSSCPGLAGTRGKRRGKHSGIAFCDGF